LATSPRYDSFSPPPLAQHLEEDFAGGENESYRGEVAKWTEPVGETFQYSNSGMGLLGLIVETMNPEQLSFGNYVLRHILEPLEMTSSRYPDGDFDDQQVVPAAIHERIGTGYAGWGGLNMESPKIYFADFPAGYLLSIPREHVRLLLAYLNGGEYAGQRILQPESVREMLRPRIETARLGPSGAIGICLAWMSGNHGLDSEWYGHGGGHMWGWTTDYRAYPKLDLAIATATNRWDMAQISSLGPEIHITGLIADLAADHLVRSTTFGVSSDEHSWSWKRSYAVGLNLAAQTKCYLGLDDPIDESLPALMLENASGDNGVEVDPDGFTAALLDTVDADFTISGLDAFLASPRCRLTQAELTAAWADVGGTGVFPFPVPPALRELFAAGRSR
jgi:hypothetical protein